MLWALLSSAYVIYLYRKLNAAQAPASPEAPVAPAGGIGAELDRLNQRLASIEARLAGTKGQEATP
jgi:hypothetical protein